MLARTYALTGEVSLFEAAKRAMDFTTSHIRQDGHWDFRLYSDGRAMVQTDFHQGFILESIWDYIRFTGDGEQRYQQALQLGADYYHRYQFLSDGRAVWRVPRQWPVDIHGQAQGIITFAGLSEAFPSFLEFARTIAFWTIQNMQDPDGFFYYRVHRWSTDKTSYIRWGQAWMFLALTVLSMTLYKRNIEEANLLPSDERR
jgi:hypothetical protein